MRTQLPNFSSLSLPLASAQKKSLEISRQATQVDSVKFGLTSNIQFNQVNGDLKSASKDNTLILVPLYQSKSVVIPKGTGFDEKTLNSLSLTIKNYDFSGKAGQILEHHLSDVKGEPKIKLVGLGAKNEINPHEFETLIKNVLKGEKLKNIENAAVFLPPSTSSLKKSPAIEAIIAGTKQATYRTPIALDSNIKALPTLKNISIYTGQSDAQPMKAWEKLMTKALALTEGISAAKDRANIPYDHIVSGKDIGMKVARFANEAKALGEKYDNLETTVHDSSWVQTHATQLWAVGRGAKNIDPPKMIKIVYTPDNPEKIKEEIVLVGKGIMYDTGGVIGKQNNMNNMSKDMTGSAYVLGAIEAIAKLKPENVRVTVYVPAAFNAMAEGSYNPDAVLESEGLPVVEMEHPDAEGRLALAEALKLAKNELRQLSTAKNKNIKRKMVSVATLTGSAMAAVGKNALALASQKPGNLALQAQFQSIADEWGDPFDSLPIKKEDFKALLTNGVDYAEISNAPASRGQRGTQMAGAFLNDSLNDHGRDVFEGDYLHLDIAGVMGDRPASWRGNATGYGERTLIQFVLDEDKKLSH